MSEALRLLNDGAQEFDSVAGLEQDSGQVAEPGQTEGESQVQEPEGYEPEPSQERDPEPELDAEPQQKPEAKRPKGSAKDWAQREKARADKLKNDLAAREQAIAQMQQQFAAQQAEIQKFQREAKINANPMLKRASDLMAEGYKPENVEAEAQQREQAGDREGAEIARTIAMHMRNLDAEQAQEQQAQQAQQAETQWRTQPYGTRGFDEAVWSLKPGTEEFNQAWGFVEQQLIANKAKSADPWDQYCARQFNDKNSEFGQLLTHFLHNTDFGNLVAKNAEGMIAAFDICKKEVIMHHQSLELHKLREENDRLRGHTSPSSGMPVNGSSYRGGALPNKAEDPDAYVRALQTMGMDELRKLTRSRETV